MRRYRNLLVRAAVRLKNKVAGLLLEIGQPYVKEKVHRKKYFYPLLEQLPEQQNSVRELLAISRSRMELALRLQRRRPGEDRRARATESYSRPRRSFHHKPVPRMSAARVTQPPDRAHEPPTARTAAALNKPVTVRAMTSTRR